MTRERATSIVTADWLADALGVEPSEFEVRSEPLATGVGLLTTIVRAHLTWSQPSPGPASVIVKLPADDPATRSIVSWFGYDRREVGAYRLLHHRLEGLVPRCLAIVDTATGPAIVLEDLSGHVVPDQLLGAGPAEAMAVVDTLAAIHAAWWDEPALTGHDWLPDPGAAVVRGYGDLFHHAWPTFCDRTDGWMTDRQRSVAERTIDWFDGAIAEFLDGPLTAIHGDARLDNMLFAPEGDAVAVDWQLAARGNGAYDVAFFVAGSLEPATRRDLEPILLDRYRLGLASRGVDIDSTTLHEWYRLGHAQNLPNPVTALVAVNPGNDRGRRLLETNARRALDALIDLGF